MRVEQMKNSKGVAVKNQFILHDGESRIFQSYDSIICCISIAGIVLDPVYWKYSRTTSKYRAQFLGEDTKTTQAKIDSGEYTLSNLN